VGNVQDMMDAERDYVGGWFEVFYSVSHVLIEALG
jgi:hypothetical protein